MAASTVPARRGAEALAYLAQGGADNLRELPRFLCRHGAADRTRASRRRSRPRVRRARRPGRNARTGRPSASSSTGRTSCPATPRSSMPSATPIEARGRQRAAGLLRVAARRRPRRCSTLLGRADALVVDRAGGGRHRRGHGGAGGDEEAWDAGALAALDVPVLQGCA